MERSRLEGIWGFVLGLLCDVLACMPLPFPYIAVACGVLGLVLSVRARCTAPGPLATAGFVLALAGLVLTGLILLFWIQCVGAMRGIVRCLGSANLA